MTRPANRTLDLSERRPGAARRRTPGSANAADRWLLSALMATLPRAGIAAMLWDGTTVGEDSGVRLIFRDRGALWRVARNPLVQFGDLYSAGRIEVEGDLVVFLERAYRALAAARRSGSPWWRIWRDQAPRSTSVAAARDNIQHHYNLGNDFYRLWLDRQAMQYTCAYYPAPGMTLEAAQRAKMDHVCRKLRLHPGQRVIEAGFGWGGFALHMARRYGVSVRAYNISSEQVRYAREWAAREGLAERVEFIEDDYRNIRGHCDAFVSVGMLEHVGVDNYAALGRVIARCLAPNGLGLIHSIGRNAPGRMNGWIERRIFPGAYPPSLGEMAAIFEPYELSILDVENLRLHYAQTLRDWRTRFGASLETVRARYDTGFVRAWDLYLAGSIAAFLTGRLQLYQVVFARGSNNEVPATRADLYG
ncbi:MAG: cyclopropane-fatty-acyl-phospholipid synthase family protein [Burkholderiales bacterium]|nr:cyclopropane-fatty-acyl-phospholipid synthase family protein [Burkholderiales bacterium]